MSGDLVEAMIGKKEQWIVSWESSLKGHHWCDKTHWQLGVVMWQTSKLKW